MAYGGIFPLKTDATTPVIGDVVISDYDSIKLVHEPAFVGQSQAGLDYDYVLENDIGLSSGFFDVGANAYPIYSYDESGNQFTAQWFKLNTFPKLNAMLKIFELFSKRKIESSKLLNTAFTERNAFPDKLVIATSGAKYENVGTVFKANFDLISGYPNDLNVYKNIVFDMVMMFLGLDINTTSYLSWITFELLPQPTPTNFHISFSIDDADKMALAQQITSLIDNGYCFNVYKYLFEVFEAILAY